MCGSPKMCEAMLLTVSWYHHRKSMTWSLMQSALMKQCHGGCGGLFGSGGGSGIGGWGTVGGVVVTGGMSGGGPVVGLVPGAQGGDSKIVGEKLGSSTQLGTLTGTGTGYRTGSKQGGE